MIKGKTLHIKFIFKIYLNIYKTSQKHFRLYISLLIKHMDAYC